MLEPVQDNQTCSKLIQFDVPQPRHHRTLFVSTWQDEVDETHEHGAHGSVAHVSDLSWNLPWMCSSSSRRQPKMAAVLEDGIPTVR